MSPPRSHARRPHRIPDRDRPVAHVIEAFREAPHSCPYLPDRAASNDVRIAVDVSAAEFGHMLERGWRRFGPTYFRPACRSCEACIPTRVSVRTFNPSASQRRARRLSSRLVRRVGLPQVDRERLDLYAKWHRNREQQRDWAPSALDMEQYASEFAFPHPSVREVSFSDPDRANRLIGIGIVDEVPGALSAVYFFWDPDLAPSSLGTAHVLALIEDAAARGLDHVYLGYRVAACPSLAYKGRFQPQEALAGRPGDDEAPAWGAAEVTS